MTQQQMTTVRLSGERAEAQALTERMQTAPNTFDRLLRSRLSSSWLA